MDDFTGNSPNFGAAPPLNTLVRLQNDGSADVDVNCSWMDGHRNRMEFTIRVTRNQAVWFDARTGRGSTQVNPFPTWPANGFTASNRHPFLEAGGARPLPAPPAQLGTGAPAAYDAPVGDGYGPYHRGLLACWAVDGSGMANVKWNHLSGTATVYSSATGGNTGRTNTTPMRFSRPRASTACRWGHRAP